MHRSIYYNALKKKNLYAGIQLIKNRKIIVPIIRTVLVFFQIEQKYSIFKNISDLVIVGERKIVSHHNALVFLM